MYKLILVSALALAGCVSDDASDDANSLSLSNASDDSKEYDYVQRDDSEADDRYDDYIGGLTNAANMPSNGKAIYTGYADGDAYLNGAELDLYGVSQLTADFDAGKVDITVSAIRAEREYYASRDTLVDSPIDSITISSAVISGNRFNGGEVEMLKNGTIVTPTGTGTSTSNVGALYGFDPTAGFPTSAAGEMRAVGNAGYIEVEFSGR